MAWHRQCTIKRCSYTSRKLTIWRGYTGPEVTGQAVRVLETIASKSSSVKFNLQSHDFGGIAIDNHGNPLPDSTLEACKKSDAILLGRSQDSTMAVNSTAY